MKNIRVFYSWQSDLPNSTNKGAIRQALRAAATNVENTLSEQEVSITLDEATRGVAGSPNIPQSILNKIEIADIFIADVTTINFNATEGRKFPNPNVVFELGYAVAHVGWNRVIMLVNTEFGGLSELPFDFDRHRASTYTISENSNNNQIKELTNLLKSALESIITTDPSRPAATKALSPEEEKRNKDIKNIRWVMSTIHIPTLDEHVQQSPHYLSDKVLHFWIDFNGVMMNSLFHLYDEDLEKGFRDLHTAWHTSISFDKYYHSNANGSLHIFSNTGDASLSKEKKRAWDKIRNSNTQIKKSLDIILSIVRDKYVEVDIDHTNKTAWQEYIETQRKQSSLICDE